MNKNPKLKFIAILIYIIPILVITILTKSSKFFLLSVGFMTTLLGLSMRFIPNYIGYSKETDKYSNSILFIISGIIFIIISTSY